MRIEVLDSELAMAELADAWRALAVRVKEPHLSQTFDWCLLSWQLLHRKHSDRVVCLTVWSDNDLLAVWPFRQRRIGLLRHLFPLGTIDGWNCTGPLLDPQCDAQIVCMRLLAAASQRGDVVHVHLIDEGACLQGVIEPLKGHYFRQCHDTLVVDPHVKGTWAGFMSGYSKNMRNQLSAARAALEQLGRVRFEVARCHGRKTEIVDWALAQKQSWADQRQLRTDWLFRPETAEFLRKAARTETDVGDLGVFALTRDGVPVAAWLGPVTTKTVGAMMIAYAPEYESYSPGILLVHDVLRWSYHSNRCMELGSTSAPYKERWAPQKRARATYQIGVSVLGRLYFVASTLKSRLRRLAG